MLKYSDGRHVRNLLYMKMFLGAFVVLKFGSDGFRVNTLGSVCVCEGEKTL